jgi:hypothetical protein
MLMNPLDGEPQNDAVRGEYRVERAHFFTRT